MEKINLMLLENLMYIVACAAVPVVLTMITLLVLNLFIKLERGRIAPLEKNKR